MPKQDHTAYQPSDQVNYEKHLGFLGQDPDPNTDLRVGLLEAQGRNSGLVRLDRNHPEYGREIYIPQKDLHGAPFGMKVIVRITGPGEEPVRGEIVEVLGDPERPDTAMLSIIHDYGLSPTYPQSVLAEVKDLANNLSPEDIQAELAAGRHDLRELFTLTIDGQDAKDLDDAISIEREGDKYRLWVHIADVSHYVHFGSKLDDEALSRGNSVYLVDRVLPMLPAKLSNQLCSLNPGVDRFSFTCEMLFDSSGKRLEAKLYPALIKSDYRANYDEIYEATYPADLAEPVQTMQELASLLADQRHERGALVFDFPETVVSLDSQGRPIAIAGAKTNSAHGLIESFMIAANEAAADFATSHKLPVVYRVHEDPDPEKISRFRQVVASQGLKTSLPKKFDPKSLQNLMSQLSHTPQSETLSYLLLRSLAKAEYQAKNLGHFGLASTSYLHFTAPIRRYADLHTHRVLKRYLLKSGDRSAKLKPYVNQIAKHISLTERIAVSAERASLDQKICEFYADKLGQVFPATISGFSPIAFYARMDNTAEGTIMYSDLDGYYTYDELHFKAVNRHGRALRLGDKLTIQLARVDLQRRFLDFTPVEFLSGDLAGTKNSGKSGRKARAYGKRPSKSKRSVKYKRKPGPGGSKSSKSGPVKAKKNTPKAKPKKVKSKKKAKINKRKGRR